MNPLSPIAIAAAAVIVSVLAIGVLKFRRWPEGRKRALRIKRRRWL